MLHSKKAFYSKEDLYQVKNKIKKDEPQNVIDLLSVLSYFNEESVLVEYTKDLNIDRYNDLVKMYVLKETARAFKNLGKYDDAATFYCDLLSIKLDEINEAYSLTLLSKFLGDYFQRSGFNKSLLTISFNRVNKNYSKISIQQKSALRVIFDSYEKEFKTSENTFILTNPYKSKFDSIKRIVLNKIEKELISTQSKETFRKVFLKMIKLIRKQKEDGNEKSFGEKAIKLISILRNKEYKFNDDLIMESELNSLMLDLKSILKSGEILNDKKLVCGALKEMLVIDLKNQNLDDANEKFSKIKSLLWTSNKIIYLPHYLIECLQHLFNYSIKLEDSNAFNLANLYLEINQLLFSQLLIDEEIFRSNSVESKKSNIFSKIKDKLSEDEVSSILKSFRVDYEILLKNFQEAIIRFTQIKYLKNVFDQSKLLDEFIAFNIHDFSSELKKIKGENQNYGNNTIEEAITNLYEITNKWEHDKNELMAKEIELYKIVNDMIEVISNSKDFIKVNFFNEINNKIKIRFPPPLLRRILYVIMKNISLHKDSEEKVFAIFRYEVDLKFGYLVLEDNIGEDEKFLDVVDVLNKNSDTIIKSRIGSGNGLKNTFRTLQKVVSKNIQFKCIIKEKSKFFYLPIQKYE